MWYPIVCMCLSGDASSARAVTNWRWNSNRKGTAALNDKQKLNIGQPPASLTKAQSDPLLSSTDVKSKFRLLTLRYALRDRKPTSGIGNRLGWSTRTSDHAFAACNSAFFSDGAYIKLPRRSV